MGDLGAEDFAVAGAQAMDGHLDGGLRQVQAGGNLLVCGGVYSLGKSRWDESILAEVLPFNTQPFWDLISLAVSDWCGNRVSAPQPSSASVTTKTAIDVA